jgi:hypothetical protein
MGRLRCKQCGIFVAAVFPETGWSRAGLVDNASHDKQRQAWPT